MAAKDWAGNVILDVTTLRERMLKKLDESGLNEVDANKLRMAPLTAAECAGLGYWRGALPAACGFTLPYFDPWTSSPMLNVDKTQSTRARTLTDSHYPADKDGKARRFNKYTQTPDSMPHAYFPTLIDWPRVFSSLTEPLFITEGELKSACATKLGFPTIGLGGVWSFMSKKQKFNGLLPELERVPWEGRKIYVAFDSDVTEKSDVQKAMRALAARLTVRGAEVFVINIPHTRGGKVGLDDFLVAKGDKAFKDLIEIAEPLTSWQSFYQMDGGKILDNAANAGVALTLAPEIQDVFAYDQMALSIVLTTPLPDDDKEDFKRRPLADVDADKLRAWLQRDGGLRKIGMGDVNAAINIRAHEREFHPVREWLRTLKWDKRPRLNTWLVKYMSATDNPEYLARIGSMFLISMVARVEKPGCQVDYALMWIGAQGDHKSTACRVLAGDEWFSDQLPHLDHADEKRLSMHMRGKWLIEIAEFGAMKKAEIEDVKKFLTRQTEKYLPSYARHEANEDRQCVFIVTTNDEKPLKDDTGNRRWWPASVGEVKIDALRRDREQLLAEAFYRYQAGEQWYADKEEEQALIRPEQDKRFEGGEWDEEIEEYLLTNLRLAATGGRANLHAYRATATFIATNALKFDIKAVTNGITKKISTAMRRLGWEQKYTHGKGYFVPPKDLLSQITVGPTKNIVPIRKPKH